MKFKEMFTENYSVNWDFLLTISPFSKMVNLEQNREWHKEDCWTHTMLVTQAMENLLNRNLVVVGSSAWVMCMAAALCHDLGKADTTRWSNEKNDWTTKNHGVVGERITRNLFYDEDIILREKVCYMVRHHMTLHHVYDKPDETNKRLIKLSHGIVPMKYMILLNIADSLGSKNDIETEEFISEKEMRLTNDVSTLRCYQKPYSFVSKSQLIRNFIGYSGEIINNTNDFCVYILCGFPGSGKSTYIKKYLSDKKVISRDVIRGELGIGGATIENEKKVVGSNEEEDKVSKIFDKRMIECCENKESFVIDNTNLRSCYRIGYLLKVMKYNPLIKIIYIEAPSMNVCKERRKGEIPNKVYERMYDSFEFPQLYECDELLIVKQYEDGMDEGYIIEGDVIPNIEALENSIVNDLVITRGAMILDGYDCYDSCVKYMDELIKKYNELV